MSAKIYACLLGNWVDITDTDPLINGLTIDKWLSTQSPIRIDRLDENDLKVFKETILQSPLIEIFFENKTYAINPIFLQFVY